MKKRIISAVIALAIFIPIIIIGGLTFEIAATLLSILGVRELFKLIKKNGEIPMIIEILSYLLTGILVLSSDSFGACLSLILLFLLIPLVFFSRKKYNFETAIKVIAIVIFIGYSFYIINNIRLVSLEEFIYLLSVSCATDIFAYFGGKFFGKTKLLESVSPNKTIEGSLIGTFAGVLIPTLVYIFVVNTNENVFITIIMAFILSVIGQIGDLVFSSIKRNYEVKDFSSIMPGHGGVLDRFDSLIFISIAYTIIKLFII